MAGVPIIAIDSYVRCGTTDAADAQVIEHLLAEAALAADLGARAVRVFPGAAAPAQDELIIARLRTAASRLPAGVEIWLETHDSHRTGRDAARVLRRLDHERVRAIWDVAHPVAAGEAWADTLAQLRPYLAHVQIKDEDRARSPVALGTGVLPLAEILRALQEEPYDGWLSLEWEKKWHPEAAELEPTLVAGKDWLGALGLLDG
jgi:sugar phosphate isomerase/epimerase